MLGKVYCLKALESPGYRRQGNVPVLWAVYDTGTGTLAM